MADLKNDSDLKLKEQRIKELGRIINMSGGVKLTEEQTAQIEKMKQVMIYRLDALVLECKKREADIKIEVYETINAIVRKINV